MARRHFGVEYGHVYITVENQHLRLPGLPETAEVGLAALPTKSRLLAEA